MAPQSNVMIIIQILKSNIHDGTTKVYYINYISILDINTKIIHNMNRINLRIRDSNVTCYFQENMRVFLN